MPTHARPALLAGSIACLVIVAACSGSTASSGDPSGTPAASGSPGPSVVPSESPADFGVIEHATGATDVVLRYDEGGGFVMPAFLASQAPIFTLYGDGTVIFRNPAAEPPPPVGDVFRFAPFRTARLTEDQIQATLLRAINEGGLGIARPEYTNQQVADASTATFTLNAGGLHKTVDVYALGLEVDGMPDLLPRKAFSALAASLADFDQGGTIETQLYSPPAYRGILLDGNPGDPAAVDWPWPDVAPSDFVSAGDPDAFPLPMRVMSVEEVQALGIDDFQGGWQGMSLNGPDGKAYTFALRPLLPDDPTQPASA